MGADLGNKTIGLKRDADSKKAKRLGIRRFERCRKGGVK